MIGGIVGQRPDRGEPPFRRVGQFRLGIFLDDLVVIQLGGSVVLPFFVILGDGPIAERLLGVNLPFGGDQPGPLGPNSLPNWARV